MGDAEEQTGAADAKSGSLVLTKGLRVLTQIAHSGGEIGIRELARETKLPTSVVHRLVSSLLELRYVEQNAETGKYRVGVQAFEVGRSYLKSARIEVCAPPVMRKLVNAHQLNAFLGVMRDQSVVYLIALQDFGPYNIRVAPGSQVPLTTTAMGRVLLADLSDEQIGFKLAQYAAQKFSAPELPSHDDMMKHLAQIRRQGYDISQDESFHGVVSVGAPIHDFSGRVVAALSVGRPMHLETSPSVDDMIACAREAAAEISAGLGASLRG